MTTPHPDPRQTRIEEATSRRLARLRTAPVDISRLESAVRAETSRPTRLPTRRWAAWRGMPSRAAAASLLILALVGALVLHSSSGPALASAEQLLHIHDDVLHDSGDAVTRVDSAAAVNATLAREAPGVPPVPDLPPDHVRSCCAHMLCGKRLACVKLQLDGVPVTMAVAAASDIRAPAGRSVSVEGTAYDIQSMNGVTMVMHQRGNRWVCLMSSLPADRLIAFARALRN